MSPVFQEVDWGRAVLTWLMVIASTAAVAVVLSGLYATLSRRSLVDGFALVFRRMFDLFRDLFALSPRRVWAIAWHSMLEAVRRRMLLAVLAVFVVVFLFAGWYLPTKPTEQVKVYVSFVLLSSTLIAMVAGGLLACLSLPSDIQDRTIHTVVTKPVRRLEIVIGRIFGLTLVATIILMIMGVMSHVYLSRTVNNSLAQLRSEVAKAESAGDATFEAKLKDDIEQIESRMTARVAVYGDLVMERPLNVGYESTYRSYIEGNKTDAAVWKMRDLPTDRLLEQNQIPLEMTFTVFRTTKGEVGRGVLAQITYRNPHTGAFIVDYPFEVREYYVNRQTLVDSPERPLATLLRDCQNALDIEVRCLSSSQYLGMAQPDLYILLENASFGLNFAKGVVGVWLRVFLIICVAVMFSTFLSSYVAMLATAAVFAGGVWMPYLRELAMGRAPGGGPLEAAKRLVTQENLERPLDPGFWTNAIQGFDQVLTRYILGGLTYLVPDLGAFNMAPLVANGFDVSAAHMIYAVVVAFAYAIPITLTAYFFLQSREIAR